MLLLLHNNAAVVSSRFLMSGPVLYLKPRFCVFARYNMPQMRLVLSARYYRRTSKWASQVCVSVSVKGWNMRYMWLSVQETTDPPLKLPNYPPEVFLAR